MVDMNYPCHTCYYSSVGGTTEPCSSCVNGQGDYDGPLHWAPKEEENPEVNKYGEAKDCQNCSHRHTNICCECVEWLDGRKNYEGVEGCRDHYEPAGGKYNYTEMSEDQDLMSEELPMTTNDKGGKQSDIPGRYDLLPSLAIAEFAAVLKHGADKYGEHNWKLITAQSHINHALRHLIRYLEYQDLEDLTHAGVRVMFAIDRYLNHDEV